MKRAIVNVQALRAGYEKKIVLQDISFSAGQGELIGIIGANGAGKSTLLRTMRGLLPRQGGRVELLGREVGTIPEKALAKQVAFLQQAVEIGFGYTSKEVVAAGRYPYLSWWQGESPEDEKIIRESMEYTDVLSLADTPLANISGGQKQRVLLAKVLAQQTPILFLDEPMTGLDVVYQEEIFRFCQRLCHQGKTILLVVHDLSAAARFCSRLLLIGRGGLLADGPPTAVLTREHLSQAYGLPVQVVHNPVTGSVEVFAGLRRNKNEQLPRVHVIAGGGCGCPVIRRLATAGFEVSVGVVAEGDSDAEAARIFAEDYVITKPFADNDADAAVANGKLVARADVTVLCSLHVGKNNLGNLDAAMKAEKLIILEDSPIDGRDYTGGRAAALYRQLLAKHGVKVMSTSAFYHEMYSLHEDEKTV
ncbi:ABC transporter ATP-binding protein [Sporomusa termitida]|uniref:Vitamin B12 import ATP-binding protein BtuD n=1 Tax=Sporomusa termitida TaxID=2377 RepID=A0A517DP02_9FIRM|nr:ABC transporter ATP-binding protein [Sporomusa termitida]QDR79089.1 Vitamin B12 import ATP-binding protein BtuD [Sporomusa termitida]